MKSVPETTTRVAMLTKHASMFWIEFADQWDPKSPWHDKRLRQAVNAALDRKAINDAACLGYCPPAGVIVPRVMEFALQVPPHAYDPKRAKQLLSEAGYPNGIDAGDVVPTPPFFAMAEATLNYLNAVGIRTRLRPMERAAFYSAWREKKLRGLFIVAAGNSGNAASRVEAFMYSKGSYAYGGYPGLDDLFQQQARPPDLAPPRAPLPRLPHPPVDPRHVPPHIGHRTPR